MDTFFGAKDFINEDLMLSAFLVTTFLIWVIVIATFLKARSIRQDPGAIITEYDPPQGISPVFARYLLVSGREGGHAGELSRKGNQLTTLINLYEDGLLKSLKMLDESRVEYEVHENYINMDCSEEEKIFLNHLVKEIGMKGLLQELVSKKSHPDGFSELNKVWITFWHTDLQDLAFRRGYMHKGGNIANALSFFSLSLSVGFFIAIFIMFIPYIGIFIAGILLLPVLIVFAVGYGITSLLAAHFPYIVLNEQAIGFIFPVLAFFIFLSWIAWQVILSRSLPILGRRLTPQGLEIVRKLKGYEAYLKTVDKDRLSFSFNRDNDFSKTRTTFSWLGIFGMVTDKHWDQWYSLSKNESGSNSNLKP